MTVSGDERQGTALGYYTAAGLGGVIGPLKVMRGLRLLQKHGIEYNIRTTVNRVNGDHPLGVYRFLRDETRTDWSQFPRASPQGLKNAVFVKWCELAHLTTYATRSYHHDPERV